MSLNFLLRLGLGLLLAGMVGAGYARSRRMEAGEPREDDRKDAVVYGDPNTFAMVILAFAVLAVVFDGPEQGSHLAVRMLLESAADLSLYFLLLLLALPLLRRRFSARLCASLWLVPSFVGVGMNTFLNYRRVPSFVIPLREELLAALGWVWLAGFLLVFGGRVMGDRRFRRELLTGAYPEEDPEVLAIWREVLLAMDLPWEVRLLRSPAARSPLSLREGRKKYATVLPERDYTEEELRFLFSHELHHLQRRDIDTKVFLAFCQGLCWFNPLVWLAAAKGSDDLELSCDEVVLAGQDERRRRDYAHLLLQSAAEGRGFTTCLSARGKSLRYRLENVLKPRKRRSGTVLLAGVTLAVFLSWGTCAVSTRQGSLGELAFPQGWESMEIEIHLENGDAPRRDCPEPERLLAYLAALPAEELEILGQVADDEDPQLCLTFGEYWEYYTVTGRTTQPRYAHGNRKNTAWVLAAPLDWAAVEGYFPAP
ncbi:MAG: M56 family metallopeptidase [Dysosmobacter sp.]|nr:M56 family metallopeptidase [Dysosmobacter sp.]